MYENVFIPTDGCAKAVHAAEHGLSFVASLEVTVRVLCAVEYDGACP